VEGNKSTLVEGEDRCIPEDPGRFSPGIAKNHPTRWIRGSPGYRQRFEYATVYPGTVAGELEKNDGVFGKGLVKELLAGVGDRIVVPTLSKNGSSPLDGLVALQKKGDDGLGVETAEADPGKHVAVGHRMDVVVVKTRNNDRPLEVSYFGRATEGRIVALEPSPLLFCPGSDNRAPVGL